MKKLNRFFLCTFFLASLFSINVLYSDLYIMNMPIAEEFRDYENNVYIANEQNEDGKTFLDIWNKSEKEVFWIIRTTMKKHKKSNRYSFYEAANPSSCWTNFTSDELEKNLNQLIDNYKEGIELITACFHSKIPDRITQQDIINIELFMLTKGNDTAKLIASYSKESTCERFCTSCECAGAAILVPFLIAIVAANYDPNLCPLI